MIRLKNQSEMLFRLRLTGAAATTSWTDTLRVPFNGFIKAIYARFNAAGVSGSPNGGAANVQIDIQKNGTTIFADAAHTLTIADPGTLATTLPTEVTYNAPVVDPTAVAKGDLLAVKALQILAGSSPTQPVGLDVYIVLSRGMQSPAGTLLGKVASND